MTNETNHQASRIQRIAGTGIIPVLRAGYLSVFFGVVTFVDFWLTYKFLHYQLDIVSIGMSFVFALLLLFAWHSYLFFAVEVRLDAECFKITYPIHTMVINREDFIEFSRVVSRLTGMLYVSIRISSGKHVRFHIAPRSYLFESDLEKRYEPILNMLKEAPNSE